MSLLRGPLICDIMKLKLNSSTAPLEVSRNTNKDTNKMSRPHKIKKYRTALALLLAFFATFGVVSAAALTSHFTNNFGTNLIAAESYEKKMKDAQEFLKQFSKDSSVSRPETGEKIDCAYIAPKKAEYKGEFISPEVRVDVEKGGLFTASVYLKNTGNVPWFGDASGCGGGVPYLRLGTARARDRGSVFYNPGDSRWVQANRIEMIEPRIDPGEIATFSFESHAPKVTDIFREYFQPVFEGKQWLETKQETVHVDIYVGANDEEAEKKLFYLGHSGQASSLDISGEAEIHIDISEQKLRLQFGNTVVREYMVSTGTFKTPTPLGRFKVLNKQELRIGGAKPHYRMPKWQGFTKWGHGLHSLPYLANDRGVFWKEALNHIGQRVSHGCVRLLPEDAEELFTFTEVGIPVVIHA